MKFSNMQQMSPCQNCYDTKQLITLLLFSLVVVVLTVFYISFLPKASLDQAIQKTEWFNATNLTKSTEYSGNGTSWKDLANETLMRSDVTVVTAYFNIGIFYKGETKIKYTPNLYLKWMTVFARLESPVVAYFDKARDLAYFRQIRSRLPANLTSTILVNREQMWSFALKNKIAAIFAKPNYPKFHPDTVVPMYSSAMHAKYEVMQQTISRNPFGTKYFCWLDIGLFRQFSKDAQRNPDGPRFSLHLPSNYQHGLVAYQEVFERNPNVTAEQIVRGDLVWVCGCFFIGNADAVYLWTAEYKEAVLRMVYIDELMASDQQVIYAAYNSAVPPSTVIQAYRRGHDWFGLGYLSANQQSPE